ncbi:hypothetical protein D3C81_288070 [compost metagenome]
MKDYNTQKDAKPSDKAVDQLGTQQKEMPGKFAMPVERRSYDPSRPEGSVGIVAQNGPPVHFEFGIQLNNSK